MNITLPEIRYYTQADPYFYTVDNRPLTDLASGQVAIKTAFETFTGNETRLILTGAWPLSFTLSTSKDRGAGFAVKIKTWATVDTAVQSPPVATYTEDILIGYASATGVVTVSGITNQFKTALGAGTLTVSAVASDVDQITITFGGYTGTRGLVNIKAERSGSN